MNKTSSETVTQWSTDVAQYDVAFSLLSEDVPIAQQIQSFLPQEISSFLYTERQQELILARDGLNAVPSIFREAKICVVLYREGWGESRWTRLEQQILADRYLDEGARFLLLLRLDGADVPAWLPRTDFWVNFVTEGAEQAARHIVAALQNHEKSPLTRVTRRALDRRSVPIARYQMKGPRNWEVYIPTVLEICDACTAGVQFRPIMQIRLQPVDGMPAVEEQLCPRCARERGLRIMIPPGMTEESVYASQNPRFADHVKRLLKSPVLPSLSADEDLRQLGVTHVGAAVTRDYVTLLVAGPQRHSVEVALPLSNMERAGIRSETAVFAYAKAQIRQSLSEGSSRTD